MRLALTAALLAAGTLPAPGLELAARRPPAGAWRRTRCGSARGGADLSTRWAAEVSPTSTPLPEYPRPQLVRTRAADLRLPDPARQEALRAAGDPRNWASLNGLWEWEKADSHEPPFHRTLVGAILVPFPVESCLSGVAPARSADAPQRMWYRLVFDISPASVQETSAMVLHFGAVDWRAIVWLNERQLCVHEGGYDGFQATVERQLLRERDNVLVVGVFDPTEFGPQPNGKQRRDRIDHPEGDTYTSNSGIWQTVWLEALPSRALIRDIKITQASMSTVTVEWRVAGLLDRNPENLTFVVSDGTEVDVRVTVATGSGMGNTSIALPSPKPWSPDSPHLYDLTAICGEDLVLAYFGLRTFSLGNRRGKTKPLLNGNFTFMTGFLDQSWWPDGIYTAPTDRALASDLEATKQFGFNMIRLHQKINSERWYYHADRLGLAVFQDMVQKYGAATNATVAYFLADARRAVQGRGSHPCIVQWTIFNEDDCWRVFNATSVGVKGTVESVKALDPTRLVDTDSGGQANGLGIGDVNDIHSYPQPKDARPSGSQYAMVGEFGGFGLFFQGREWLPRRCYGYEVLHTAAQLTQEYIRMAKTLESRVDHLSASVYTQTTDVERECDGFLSFDRASKFDEAQTRAIADANRAIISAGREWDQGSLGLERVFV